MSMNPLVIDETADNFTPTKESPLLGQASDGSSDIGAVQNDGTPYPTPYAGLLSEDTIWGPDNGIEGLRRFGGSRRAQFNHRRGRRSGIWDGDIMKAGVDRDRSEIIVYGTLNIIGTADNKVTLRGQSEQLGRWYGLRWMEGAAAA